MPTLIDIKNDGIDAKVGTVMRGNVRIPHKTFSTEYIVISDTINDREDEILATSGLPPLFFQMRGAYCINRTAKEVTRLARHPTTFVPCARWAVICEFDSHVDDDEANEEGLPLDQKRPSVRWYGEQQDELLVEEKEIEGEKTGPIQTFNGEPLNVTAPMLLPILEVRRYEIWPFNPNIMLDYANHVNDSPFYGAPKGTALMLPMEVSQEMNNNIRYNVIVYRIKFKMKKKDGDFVENTWFKKVLHEGYRIRKVVGGPVVVNRDGQGHPISKNLSLTTGMVLADDPALAEYKIFEIYGEVDFNALNLGPFT